MLVEPQLPPSDSLFHEDAHHKVTTDIVNTDPIKLELYKNMLTSVAEEMGVTLQRTAFSPNIKERLDFSCAVFDGTGKMVAQAAHIPVHLGSMPLSVLAAIEHTEMAPGDMIALNDPYRGGTHLPDITLVAPVFSSANGSKTKNEPVFFVANRAHHADVGGMAPGSMPIATSVIQEGIRIPPVKLIRAGELDTDLWELILANVRTPEERRGDMEAQLAANRVGERRLREMITKYGVTEIAAYMEELCAYASRMIRARLQEIPDGRYVYADVLDNDGITDEPIEIRVAIEVENDTAVVDFTGTAPQVRGSVNAIYAITLSAVFYTFRCIAGADVPANAGCLEPIRVIAPEGTVVNANFPAAVAGGNVETSQRIVDVLLGALAQACPDQIPAASSGTMNNLTIGGYDASRGKDFTYYETIAGGMGARPNRDGIDAIHTHMTNTMNTPIEAIETNYPMQVAEYAIRRGTGGTGKFRGGAGVIRALKLLTDAEVTILSERRTRGPYGLQGGESGQPGCNVLISDGEEHPLAGKVSVSTREGDVIRIETPGGGGFLSE
ncbi:hydantoinase B/oxoprolinase family protein [Candidatus Poribacteria bacterium]|nr:hydantoinase B/oxoprolinase family protein [Candidatus Poribacteria bacterium]MYH81148.1 hydantoinase B/oxoprolinase family protein [Candidatus Poribacteria bacterium]MYK92578.1 hydantoinase B/oxoprolinase family protein [Candidatus Poribacteria bacterium]